MKYKRQDEAKKGSARIKERRNPSADAHGEPMSGGKPLFIVNSWAWAIRYRPSLCHRLALTYLPCTPRTRAMNLIGKTRNFRCLAVSSRYRLAAAAVKRSNINPMPQP